MPANWTQWACLLVSIALIGCGPSTASPASTASRVAGVPSGKTKRGKDAGAPGGSSAESSKYPAPFMEPDCAEVSSEGYLANAKEAIATVRRAHFKELQDCADAAPEGVAVHGEVKTSFRLDPDGVPRCVEAPGSSLHVEVVRCVLSTYRMLRFPAPKGGSVHVTDGIELTRTEEDE